MASRVTVVGDATLDVRAVPTVPLRPGGDVPATVTLGPGGQGANIAVRLARRGVATRLACRLGTDPAGDLVRPALAADGVELVELGAASTATVVVLLDATGERTMLSQRVSLLDGDLPAPILVEPDWLIVSGYVLLERSTGIPASGATPRRVIAGCSLAPEQAGDWAAAARSLQPHIVVLNLEEAAVLAGSTRAPSELSSILGETLGALVIVTERIGATVTMAGEVIRAGTDPGEPPVDTTGAGDAFTAGVVESLIEVSWPPSTDGLRAAMAAGGALAAAVTGVLGAQGRVAGEAGGA